MTTQQTNIKPNGTEEVSSLIMLKTILEVQADELLTMTNEANNEGMPMEVNAGFFMYALLLDVIALVQASIDNDFDVMRGYLPNVGASDLHLQKDDEQMPDDTLLDALNALCPNNPGLAFFVWQTSVKMIEEAKGTGRRIFAFPQTQVNTGQNRAQRRQTARKKKR